MKKRFMPLLLATVVTIGVLSGCGNNNAENPASADNGLHISIASTPETIDPQLNSSLDGGSYLVHLSEGLMRYSRDGKGVEYGLADSHTVSEDGTIWTFNLRPGIKWSDGQDIVADDFVYSFRRLVDPMTAAPYAEDMGKYIKNGLEVVGGSLPVDSLGVVALDSSTIEITLSGPTQYFDEVVAFPTFYPVRKDIIEANGDRWTREASTYVSTGAYKMESFSLDRELVIVPNEHYYDKDNIVAEKIVFHFLADEGAALAAFQTGEIVLAQPVSENEKTAQKELGNYQVVPQLGTYYLSLNVEKEPLNDINVRKALNLAIDRDFISNVVRQGSVVSAESFVGPGFLDADDSDFRANGGVYLSNDDYEANKAEAQKALADAGYPNGEGFPKLEYIYNENMAHQQIGEAIQNMWKEVLNIDIELRVQEWNVFLDTRRKGDFEIARNGWIADYNDPMSMLTIFQTGGGNNDSNYSNAQFDEYLKTSIYSSDRAERMEAMHNAEAIMMNEWATVPIYYYANEFLISQNLVDWAVSPLGYVFLHNASVK